MEHTHDYPDGSQQMPLPLGEVPDLSQMLAGKGDMSVEEVFESARGTLSDQLDLLRRMNKDKYNALIQMGVQPAPQAIIMARLEQLLDMVLDEDTRIGFDIGFEGRMSKILDDGLREARQQQLLRRAGPSGPIANGGHPPGLILPG